MAIPIPRPPFVNPVTNPPSSPTFPPRTSPTQTPPGNLSPTRAEAAIGRQKLPVSFDSDPGQPLTKTVPVEPVQFDPPVFDDTVEGEEIVVTNKNPDWRFRVSLAPESNYLYNSSNPGVLAPLIDTQGVIFPYTPTISTTYMANYSNHDITHTNYKFHQYTNSSVEAFSVTGRFTAQDVKEAQYILAAIHFFRSMTKMFYGQDTNPIRGTPPPLCYLNGFGAFQFSNHPAVVQSFTYTLPNEVDYIPVPPPVDLTNEDIKGGTTSQDRLGQTIRPGGDRPAVFFSRGNSRNNLTWIPSKVDLVVQFLPIMSRNDVSNTFSLDEYASGNLYNGAGNGEGGFW